MRARLSTEFELPLGHEQDALVGRSSICVQIAQNIKNKVSNDQVPQDTRSEYELYTECGEFRK